MTSLSRVRGAAALAGILCCAVAAGEEPQPPMPCFAAATQAKEQPPNILLILADDMGYGDLSCYGAKKNCRAGAAGRTALP